MRLHRMRTFSRKLPGNLQLDLQSRARFGQMLDVACDAVEPSSFGVAFAVHGARSIARLRRFVTSG
jgi:hypothetical protein